MHTSYVPNPTVIHPTFGSVVSRELGPKRTALELPAFVSIGGDAGQAGFLGMSHAPFVVDSSGRIRNAPDREAQDRLKGRLTMLEAVELNFMNSRRGELPKAHNDVYANAVNLMTSNQMAAFDAARAVPQYGLGAESQDTQTASGSSSFGQGLLMARRLVQGGVPFIEVNLGGWDLHQGVFASLRDQKLPELDQGISALVADLTQRGMLDDVVLVWMGEFGRTPRINQDVGRDHWARSWSVVVGGGGLNNGQVIGATDENGTSVADGSQAYLPGDIWATVSHALGIPLNTVHTSKRGRPMKLANGGTPIKELIG